MTGRPTRMPGRGGDRQGWDEENRSWEKPEDTKPEWERGPAGGRYGRDEPSSQDSWGDRGGYRGRGARGAGRGGMSRDQPSRWGAEDPYGGAVGTSGNDPWNQEVEVKKEDPWSARKDEKESQWGADSRGRYDDEQSKPWQQEDKWGQPQRGGYDDRNPGADREDKWGRGGRDEMGGASRGMRGGRDDMGGAGRGRGGIYGIGRGGYSGGGNDQYDDYQAEPRGRYVIFLFADR